MLQLQGIMSSVSEKWSSNQQAAQKWTFPLSVQGIAHGLHICFTFWS